MSSEFWGLLDQEVLQVVWFHPPAGRESLGDLVAQFINGKLARGMPGISEDQKEQFLKDLAKEISEAGVQMKKAGHREVGELWAKLSQRSELAVLSEEFHWFSQEIRWTS